MLLHATTHLTYSLPEPAPFVFMLRPRSGDGQWVQSESYNISPAVPVTEYTDIYGNLCQRLTPPAGRISIDASCTAEVADVLDIGFGWEATPPQWLPSSFLHYLLPSRYCESDKLADVAMQIVEGYAPGYDQAERIRAWVQSNVAYVSGSSDASTSALDTWGQRKGVCRDQAHLAIALCRALSLPSRMVVGYLHDLEPMDLHAWFECYIGGRWWTFDAKEPLTLPGRIVIGYGRDAADVALATNFGAVELLEMQVTVERIDTPAGTI